MPQFHPYLNFNGNCEEAFDFYHSVFGGEPPFKMRFKDVPSEEPQVTADSDKIMHTGLTYENGSMIMGSDVPSGMGKAETGSNLYIYITAGSEEEADRFFNGLSDGGNIEMPMEKVFWGSYFGMLSDKYGFKWMIGYDYPKES